MIYTDLQRLDAESTPIRVGASGAGWMGSGFAAQMARVPGMELVVLADADLEAARNAFLATGISEEMVVEASSPGPATDALRSGKKIITGDLALLSKIDDVDVVTDVTPSPATGAEVAYQAIQHGKDVVLINIEADVTVGPTLKRLAKKAGVLYTVSSGDEPGCLMELYDFVNCLGFEVMVIGKGKNNPLNPQATPDTVAESARRSDKDPFQVASYVDGSKTMFEMTCAANATGCRPMKRGMNGPEATLDTVSQIFALKEDGGITTRPRSIDFVQGSAMSGGVFVTVRVEDQRIRDDLHYLMVGQGSYFTFFRPYHLWFIEAPISIARAVLKRETTLVPLDEPVADVMTIAKRDLKPGDRLDTFGGYTFYGLMDEVEQAREHAALPLGLAPDALVTKPVEAGQIVTWNDVSLDESKTINRLRMAQENRINKA
ncbi:MAG TPA: Gfo/Idh/MocA family oxidoreductase [candidate division Zixibacteria bacterium]|nr:Gfo/Idh/MocA family oxidoreductase [candidate division Zixibacteria bacterium]